jgi:hypothetical protein
MYSTREINKASQKHQTGIGSVIIARDIDRAQFVEMCYRTSTIFLLCMDGRLFEKVKVSQGLMNYMQFPEKELGMGSRVVWANDSNTGFPVIIGVLADITDMGDLSEHQFRLGRSHGESSSELSGNSETGTLLLDVTAAGEGLLKLTSDDLVVLQSSREINFQAKVFDVWTQEGTKIKIKKVGEDAETIASYKLGEGYNFKDEFGNEIQIDKDHIKFKGKKYVIETDDDFSMKELFEKFQNVLEKMQIATALGNQAPINIPDIIALKDDINKLFE